MKIIIYIIIFILVSGVIAFNGYSLIEAYGSGAPYYSRTTNMDKWSNPVPVLFIIDVVVIIITFYAFRYINNRKNK